MLGYSCNFFILSGLFLLRSLLYGCQSVSPFVHLLSFIQATCPVHLHFCCFTTCIMYFYTIFFLSRLIFSYLLLFLTLPFPLPFVLFWVSFRFSLSVSMFRTRMSWLVLRIDYVFYVLSTWTFCSLVCHGLCRMSSIWSLYCVLFRYYGPSLVFLS